MQLVRTPRCDKRDATRPQMRAKFPLVDEILLLPLCRVEFECKRIPAEVIERISET